MNARVLGPVDGMLRRLAVPALLVGSSVIALTGATAQTAPPADAAAAPAEAGEIVVTALKRSTRLQDTPLAISAVSGDSLTKAGTVSFTDLTRSAPSLRIIDGGPGNRRVLIRGIQTAGEPTVGVYYDESPVSGSVGTTSDAAGATPDFRLFDVERAEVLRGPQGTLFGSGSMGGTIRVIFAKPDSHKFEAAVSGNAETVQHGKQGGSIDAMINLPIVEDKIALRVVGSYQKFAGYVDNNFLNLKDINDGKSYGGRALLRLTPTEDLTIDLAAYYQKVSTNAPRWELESGRDYTTNARAESGNYDTSRIYSATVHYDLGFANVTAVSSYFDRDKITDGDVSNTFLGRDTTAGCRTYLTKTSDCSATQLAGYLTDTRALFSSSLYQPQYVHNWTNELRISSPGTGRFNWTAGVYSENRKTQVRSTLLLANPATGDLLPFVAGNIKYDRTINDHLKQFAAFVEASYKILPDLTFTAGTRYYDFHKTVGGRIDVGQIHYASVVTPYTETSSKENGFIGKFNLSWQASRKLLIYAQASQGFRPGGVNQVIGLPATVAGYSSDSLWNYEVGVKSTLTRGVYLDLSGYRIDWDNMQISARTSGTGSVFGIISNAGAARIWGGEAELSATPMAGLTLAANFGYVNAKLSEDQTSSIVVAAGKKGDRLAYVPHVTMGASAEYTFPMNDNMDGFLHADGSYVGSSYSSVSPTDVYRRKVPNYEVANVRVGVQAPDNNWGVYLYINNLFDKVAIVNESSSSNTLGQTLTYSLPPRTFGINIKKKF
jgi:iron complex outermembrane receptor protein